MSTFYPRPPTYISEVKIDQPPTRSRMTCNEFTLMLTGHTILVEIPDREKKVQKDLSNFMASYRKRKEKKSEFYVFPHDASISISAPVASQPQYMGCHSVISRDRRSMHRIYSQPKLVYSASEPKGPI